MSNVKRTTRDTPLTCTVAAGVLTTTRGKMALTKATETSLGTDARGVNAASAHFALVKAGSDARPVRYIDVTAKATGTAAATTDATVIVELWDALTEVWARAEGTIKCQGATVAAADDPAWGKGERYSVKVGRGDTLGRFYVLGLATNQGIDLVVYADNDD